MSEWKRLNRELTTAMVAGELARAEHLLAELWAEAARCDDRELESHTQFTQGMLRDAQDRFDEAEAAFVAALAIDREIHGPDHAAVADVLHSIAIVRRRRGDLEGALAAFREEADVQRRAQPFAVTAALGSVGHSLIALERFDEAGEVYAQAIDAFDPSLTPKHELNRAHLGAGEAHRRARRYPQAFSELALATWTDGALLAHELGDTVARAWHTLGIVSRHGLRDCRVQAAISFWYASQLASAGDVAERASTELATLDERTFASGDPNAWRVVYKAGGNTHVASLGRGLFHTKVSVTAELGAIVAVELDGVRVVSVQTVH